MNNPIVDEIRRIRDEHAKRFNYDLDAIFEDFVRSQSARKNRLVRREPRRITTGKAEQRDEVPGHGHG